MTRYKRKILLINPWIVDFAAYDFWIKPIGLLTIGSVLQKSGYDVSLLDCLDRNHQSLLKYKGRDSIKKRRDGTGNFYKEFIEKPEVLKWVPRRYGRYGLPFSVVESELDKLSNVDVILVTSGMSYWYPGVVEMISLLKRKFTGVPVILGGIYATLWPEHARKVSGADRVISGEGEIKGLQLVDEITGNCSDTVNYKTLDDFPWPFYHFYDSLDSAALLTSRGCPYKCPFCASWLLYDGYRRRSCLNVVDEIDNLYSRRGVKEFAFYDDALLVDKRNHIIPIIEEIISRNIQVHFHTPNGIQPREINLPLAQLMRKAGFKTVRLSFETSSEERQKSMGFKVRDEDLANAVKYLIGAGFDRSEIGSYVLMGLPGQAVKEVLNSLMFVLGLGIKVNLASFSPIPGTKSWQKAVDQGYISQEVDPLLTNNSVFPMQSDEFPYETFISLGTLCSAANRILSRGENPLKDQNFRLAADNFFKKL